MEAFSSLLSFHAGNSPVTREFPPQRLVMRSFDVFFDLRLDKRLSKQSWGWWFDTPSHSLWRHCNVFMFNIILHDFVELILALTNIFSEYSPALKVCIFFKTSVQQGHPTPASTILLMIFRLWMGSWSALWPWNPTIILSADKSMIPFQEFDTSATFEI